MAMSFASPYWKTLAAVKNMPTTQEAMRALQTGQSTPSFLPSTVDAAPGEEMAELIPLELEVTLLEFAVLSSEPKKGPTTARERSLEPCALCSLQLPPSGGCSYFSGSKMSRSGIKSSPNASGFRNSGTRTPSDDGLRTRSSEFLEIFWKLVAKI